MQVTAYSFLFVAVGGAIGAMSRLGLNLLLQRDGSVVWGTLAANLLGCLVIGFIAQLIASSSWFNSTGIIPEQYRLLFVVGFCGSFTTLSTLILELNTMLQKDAFIYAFSYLVATVAGGFMCFYLGALCARLLVPLQTS